MNSRHNTILVNAANKTYLLKVGKSRVHGRGVFSEENVPKGALLCVCPVLLIPYADPSNDGVLGAYYYEWSKTHYALGMGLVPLVNHSYKPNSEVYTVYSRKIMQLYALKNISKGDELLVDYGKRYPYIDASNYRSQ